jgi:hypothetical protein
MGNVVIAVNPTKESEMLDMYGNVIDPVTKQIIKKEEPEQ